VVDSAIYESVLAMMESTVPEYTEAGVIRERTGSILPGIAPSNVYPAADGDILIGANQDSVFSRLCKAMGRPELAVDPRYATHQARGRNQAELDRLIADWTRTLASDTLLALLEQEGVPAGRIYKAPDMLADPHFAAREALVKVPHPEFANLVMQNVVPKMSATPGAIEWPGPPLGAHNRAVWQDVVGLSDEELALLQRDGVI
jgi:crotonobetainyl-CoA:carnitine CoA-transferase CaiB-like acyl-CoA transferase